MEMSGGDRNDVEAVGRLLRKLVCRDEGPFLGESYVKLGRHSQFTLLTVYSRVRSVRVSDSIDDMGTAIITPAIFGVV